MKNTTDWRDLVKEVQRISIENGFTQVRIGESTGLQQSAVSSFFACRNIPTVETFIRISDAVGASVVIKKFCPETYVIHNQ